MLNGTLRIATGTFQTNHKSSRSLNKNDIIIVISGVLPNDETELHLLSRKTSEVEVLTQFGLRKITQFALRYLTVSENYLLKNDK